MLPIAWGRGWFPDCCVVPRLRTFRTLPSWKLKPVAAVAPFPPALRADLGAKREKDGRDFFGRDLKPGEKRPKKGSERKRARSPDNSDSEVEDGDREKDRRDRPKSKKHRKDKKKKSKHKKEKKSKSKHKKSKKSKKDRG